MEKSKERQCLEKVMMILCENKRIQLDPDGGMPYTLSVIELDEDEETPKTGSHTHCSYCYDSIEDLMEQENLDNVVNSFINHILGEKCGLSWHPKKPVD